MTTVLERPETTWVNPLSTLVIIDFDDVLTPRCPRRKLALHEYDASADRHRAHRLAKGRKELARNQRGKRELTEAQNRALFSGHPSVTPESFVGYKLTKRQRAQLKLLKKQFAGKPVRDRRAPKSKDEGMRPVRRKRRAEFIKVTPEVTSDELELLGMALIPCVVRG